MALRYQQAAPVRRNNRVCAPITTTLNRDIVAAFAVGATRTGVTAMVEKAGQNPKITGAPVTDTPATHVAGEAGQPGGPQQQRAEGSAEGGTFFERVGSAAGRGVAQISAAIDDPQAAGEKLFEAVKKNPGKAVAAAGAVWVGPTALLLGGAAAAIGGTARTVKHMSDGKSLGDAVAATRDEVVQYSGQAVDLKNQAVTEAKKAFGAASAWWSSLANKGDKGGGESA